MARTRLMWGVLCLVAGFVGCGDRIAAPLDTIDGMFVPREAGASVGTAGDSAVGSTDTGSRDASGLLDAEPMDAILFEDGGLGVRDLGVPAQDATIPDGSLPMEEVDSGQSDADSSIRPMADAALLEDASLNVDAELLPDMAPAPINGSISRTGQVVEGRLVGNANGGQRFQDDCPDGQVLIGLAGSLRDGANYLGQLQVLCGEVVINAGRITTQNGAIGALRGRFDGRQQLASTCPNGSVVVGHTGRAGGLVDQLRLYCGRLNLDGNLISLGAGQAQAPIGGDGGAPYDLLACPAGQAALGATIRAGDGVDAFGLRCSAFRFRR